MPITARGDVVMAVESTGHSGGNPRLFELIEHAPKTGKSPTVWAWPELIDYLKVAGQPVQGPWPPHQQRRPDLENDALGLGEAALAHAASSADRSASRASRITASSAFSTSSRPCPLTPDRR